MKSILLLAVTASMAATIQADGLTVQKLGDEVFIASRFDSHAMLIQKVSMSSGQNRIFDFVASSRVSIPAFRSAPTVADAYAAGEIIATQNDDAAPLRYNWTYIGANHGAYAAVEAVVDGSVPSSGEAGTIWEDETGKRFTLLKVWGNTLQFIPENDLSFPNWHFTPSMIAGVLHKVSEAGETINVASVSYNQLWPSVAGNELKMFINGVEVSNDGLYSTESLMFSESYRILSPASIYRYAQKMHSEGKDIYYLSSEIGSDVYRKTSYTYSSNGSCVVEDSIRAVNDLSLDYSGTVQASPLNSSSHAVSQYVPDTLPVGGLDFAAGVKLTDITEEAHFTKNHWRDSRMPPSRMMQIASAAGASDYGMSLGYDLAKGTGIPASRRNLVDDAAFISANKKQYPKAISGDGKNFGGILPAGSTYETVAFRSLWSGAVLPQARAFTWYEVGDRAVVLVDFDKAIDDVELPLPVRFRGRELEILRSTGVAAKIDASGRVVVSSAGPNTSAVLLLK